MNQEANILIPGAVFGGGRYSHSLLINDEKWGVILAPKADGQFGPIVWNRSMKRVAGALSYVDGLANTIAMAEAGSDAAKKARDCRIGGFDDWCIPARDQLEPAYRGLKPSGDKNYCYYRSGENPATGTYPYTLDEPKQTEVDDFRKGGSEAFDLSWYWTSTQYGSHAEYAWFQYFVDGNQDFILKSFKNLVRLVRMIKL